LGALFMWCHTDDDAPFNDHLGHLGLRWRRPLRKGMGGRYQKPSYDGQEKFRRSQVHDSQACVVLWLNR
jgi:hypothetical protein